MKLIQPMDEGHVAFGGRLVGHWFHCSWCENYTVAYEISNRRRRRRRQDRDILNFHKEPAVKILNSSSLCKTPTHTAKASREGKKETVKKHIGRKRERKGKKEYMKKKERKKFV